MSHSHDRPIRSTLLPLSASWDTGSRIRYARQSTILRLDSAGLGNTMPLDDLIDVISSLQERMEKYGAELKENETRTRMALVDPMLTVLGWNTADPSLVKAEYSVADGRADYALLGPDGKPVACIEAKRLGAPLQQHRMQMLNYCNAGGIKCAGITDGNQWELYDVFSPKPLDERRRLDITIADRSPAECALELLLLWQPNLDSGNPTAANRPILSIEPHPEPELPPKLVETKPEPPWVSLSDYDPPSNTAPPSQIRLPSGEVQGVEKWYDILLRVAQWLWSSGRLTQDQVPVSSSVKRYVLSTTPVHPSGNEFLMPVAIPNTPLLFEAHRSAAQSRSAAVKLLKDFGADSSAVWVRPSG